MFFVSKKKYRLLNSKFNTLNSENNTNIEKIKKLNNMLSKMTKEEERLKNYFSKNYDKFNNYRDEARKIDEIPIKDRSHYFMDNYDIKVIPHNNTYTNFTDIEIAKNWGEKYFADYSSKINEIRHVISLCEPFLFEDNDILNSHLSGIEYYCGYPYKQMNILLRKIYDNSFNFKSINYYKNLCNMLIFEFINAPLTPENIITYRFLNGTFFLMIIESFMENEEYEELGFLSTSLLKNTQQNTNEHYTDYNYMLKIHVPKGNRAIYTSIIAGRKFEQELLFPNNSILKPLSKVYFDDELKKITIDVSYENYIKNMDLLKKEK